MQLVFKSHLYIYRKNRFSPKNWFSKIKKKICKSWGKKFDREKGVRQVIIVQVCSFSTTKSGWVFQFHELQNVPSLSSERSYPYCDKFAPQTGLMEEVRVGTSQDFILWWGHIIGQNWSSFLPYKFWWTKLLRIQLVNFLISLMDVIRLGRQHVHCVRVGKIDISNGSTPVTTSADEAVHWVEQE